LPLMMVICCAYPFSATICVACSAMLLHSMPYTCLAPACSGTVQQQVGGRGRAVSQGVQGCGPVAPGGLGVDAWVLWGSADVPAGQVLLGSSCGDTAPVSLLLLVHTQDCDSRPEGSYTYTAAAAPGLPLSLLLLLWLLLLT
jgi:hypothetical protein